MHTKVGFRHAKKKKKNTTAFNSHHTDALEKLEMKDLSGSLTIPSSSLSFGALWSSLLGN